VPAGGPTRVTGERATAPEIEAVAEDEWPGYQYDISELDPTHLS
jgi:hypothetical protein